MIILEAADTFVVIIDTAIRWVKILAAAAAVTLCVVLFAIGPLIAPAVRRRIPAWARGPIRARLLARRRTRSQDYREAA